jgi:TetR/AcrR family transcriptional regulator
VVTIYAYLYREAVKMNYSTFEGLTDSKKEAILEASIEEFAEHGYENASTNRLVKKINMSKGSLFKYFNTKEELYIYVIDYVVKSVTSEISKDLITLPDGVFERLYMLAEIEFNLYIKRPVYYKLFKEAFNGKSDISNKLIKKYSVQAGSYFDNVFKTSDFE